MIRSLLCLTLALVAATLSHAENWPSWRGPTGMGVSNEKNLPVRWSTKKNVRWKVKLEGAGVSTPIVWGKRVWVTTSDGRRNDRLHVYCYKRNDGKLLWHTRLFGTAHDNLYPPGGMAVPTPVTDGKHLYVLFGTGELACLDMDGKPVWIRSLSQEYGVFRNRWGMATSPVLVKDKLIVLVDHWGQSYLLAVDPKTGENVWKTDRSASVNWSTPLPVKVGDHTELLVFGTYEATSYDAMSGSKLWTVDGMHMQCIPSPIVEGKVAFACSGVSTMAIKLDGKTGNRTKKGVLWTNKKANAYVPTPIVYKGLIYIPGDRGIGTCLDAKTGKVVWKKRLGSRYHASPIAGDDKIYFADKDGAVHVVQAGREFKVLAQNYMDEMIVASPAISGGNIFLRGEEHLFCIGK